MQTKLLPVLLAAALITSGLRAEESTPSPATTPPPAPTSAPAVAPVATQAAPAPNQIIYSPRLPTPAELTSVATAQGLAVQQISASSTQVTAIYKNNSTGELTTIAYQLLPTTTTTTTTVAVPTPAPTTVIYQPATRVIYYYDDPYWPRYYYPPVSLSLGFGYYHGWGGGRWGGGGHWGGGYHHWR